MQNGKTLVLMSRGSIGLVALIREYTSGASSSLRHLWVTLIMVSVRVTVTVTVKGHLWVNKLNS